jgi:hypothetical protein
MLSYKPTEKRSLGRPRRRWMSQIWGAATDESPVHEVEDQYMPCHSAWQWFVRLVLNPVLQTLYVHMECA